MVVVFAFFIREQIFYTVPLSVCILVWSFTSVCLKRPVAPFLLVECLLFPSPYDLCISPNPNKSSSFNHQCWCWWKSTFSISSALVVQKGIKDILKKKHSQFWDGILCRCYRLRQHIKQLVLVNTTTVSELLRKMCHVDVELIWWTVFWHIWCLVMSITWLKDWPAIR